MITVRASYTQTSKWERALLAISYKITLLEAQKKNRKENLSSPHMLYKIGYLGQETSRSKWGNRRRYWLPG